MQKHVGHVGNPHRSCHPPPENDPPSTQSTPSTPPTASQSLTLVPRAPWSLQHNSVKGSLGEKAGRVAWPCGSLFLKTQLAPKRKRLLQLEVYSWSLESELRNALSQASAEKLVTSTNCAAVFA